MKIPLNKLKRQLEENLSSLYVISGEQSVLIREATELIQAKAKNEGFSEKKIIACSSKTDWAEIEAENNSLSLFAEKKIIEIRVSKKKLTKDESKILIDVSNQLNMENIFIIVLPKLDKSALATQWLKSLDHVGIFIQIWPILQHDMPKWIKGRLSLKEIEASNDAIQLLSENAEGNLLAAEQEIEKLSLLNLKNEIGISEMMSLISNSVKYDPYQFIDTLLLGKSTKSLKMLNNFQQEGIDEIFLLWLITKELRILYKVKGEPYSKTDPSKLLKENGIWEKRIPVFLSALRRLRGTHLRMLISQASAIDRGIKGMRRSNVWHELSLLALSITGVHAISPNNIKILIES